MGKFGQASAFIGVAALACFILSMSASAQGQGRQYNAADIQAGDRLYGLQCAICHGQNGDGINGNDPIYVPKNGADGSEVRIGTGAGSTYALNTTSAAAFEKFISMQPCLDKQRGSIMARNSCNGPFQKRMDVSIRQTLPQVSGQRLTAQLDIFNFANLINRAWGRNYFPIVSSFNNQAVLNTAGRTAGALSTAQWNYNLNTSVQNGVTTFNSPWSVSPNSASNNYQMQLTMRYAF